ncbi:uncharacterized protein [Elaeis guineensis]|uniref:EEF1A lysine and N-terminal methyltransferase n=1 Tax=Elaeis guineensis var. tenera TaxID=51953 RepID=A0A6I9RPE7_ELAGV|nr:eEF1A lysine and N-terminal methyltransferase [Elaeis guineensis]
MAKRGGGERLEILETLGDFTSKENWDKFFTLRGTGDSFEWYAEWPALRDPLVAELSSLSTADTPIQILVPGCGSSRISEYLYDAGFQQITNIDFSKVVVSDMLRRYVRSRPEMRWRVMDMTDMQFADEFFDAILDKGGLDALMEPELGSKLGKKYLKEVKRILKSGGRYLCLTLAESHVLGLLFSEFRFGWDTSIYAIPHEPSNKPTFQTFMVTVVKEKLGALNPVRSLFDHSAVNCNAKQVHALNNAVEDENKIRSNYSTGADIYYSLEDLLLGAKGNLKELLPGRRCQLILGEQGSSLYTYKTLLLDARQQPDPFLYHCGVFIVPKTRAYEWLFTSEEGQWLVVESSKAARLIMVFLDSRHAHASMDDIQKDLSPLVKNLAPGNPEDEARIPFMMANDSVKRRNILQKVTSTITGPIIVEDVIYEDVDGDNTGLTSSDTKVFRRLTFERSLGLVQSEAQLTREPQSNPVESVGKKNSLSSKSRKKGGKKRSDSDKLIDGSRSILKVDHSCLASSYHSGIVSGFALIASALEIAASSRKKVRTIIVGLGAGLLPMFLHGCLPFLEIEVVELDPLILDLARKYFGFTEDKQLKVHIGDGIQFIQNANIVPSPSDTKDKVDDSKTVSQSHDGEVKKSLANGNSNTEIKIVIIDADSSDMSSGLACPSADFVEESFLLCVKKFLAEGGLFIINLVSRSPAIREMIVLRMKVVFSHLFSLELEEDVNEILFASSSEAFIHVDHYPKAWIQLKNIMKVHLPERQMLMQKIKCLK